MIFFDELTKVKSAYFLDEWIKLNEELWGLKAEKVCYTLPGKDLPKLETVFYLNKQGNIVMPEYNAYIPLNFTSTDTIKECQLYSQRLGVMKLLAADVKSRGYKGTIAFQPGWIDARTFQWEGLLVTVRYTFIGKLPYDESSLDVAVRKRIRKAEKRGYVVERTHDWEKVVYCMKKMSSFKKHPFCLSAKDIEQYYAYLGDTNLYAYLGISEDGKPVAAQARIVIPGGYCMDWMAGTDRDYISSGINQYIYSRSLTDAAKAGALYFDYVGANVELVAKAKSEWGFGLVPYIVLPDTSVQSKIRSVIGGLPGVRNLYHKLKGEI